MRRISLALAALLLSSPALAADRGGAPLPRSLRLDVVRGPGVEACPADDVLRDVIAARMSWDPVDVAASSRLTVQLARHGRQYTGRVAIVDPHGVTTWGRPAIRLDDCVSVVEGLGFAVAIHLDPAGPPGGVRSIHVTSTMPAPAAAPVAPAAVPLPHAAAAPLVAAVAPVARPEVPPSPVIPTLIEASQRWRVGASGGIAFGSSPAPVAGLVGFDLAYRLPPFSFGVEARVSPPSSAVLATGERLTTGLYGTALTGCATWRSLTGCGVLDVAALAGTSTAAHPTTGIAATVRTGIRGAVEVPIVGAWSVRLTGDALLPIVRGAAAIDGRIVWTAPILAGVAQAGVTVNF